MNTIEEIINVTLSVGETRKSVSITPPAGRVIGVVAYPNKDVAANAAIKSDDGQFVSKPQHIKNYRSREACYFDGCKPVDFDTKGRTYFVEVTTDKAIENEAYELQFVFIYEDTRQLNCSLN